MSMTTKEILMLKTLQFKETHTGGQLGEALLDHALEKQPEAARNICAMISVPLFNDIETYCSLLDISKRRFVEMALQDLLEKTKAVIDEVNPFMDEEA